MKELATRFFIAVSLFTIGCGRAASVQEYEAQRGDDVREGSAISASSPATYNE